MIHNYMEDIVEETLKEILKKDEFKNVCTCSQCWDDMLAFALNNLKPLYGTSIKGRVFSEYNAKNAQNRMDLYKAVIMAIEIVSANKHA